MIIETANAIVIVDQEQKQTSFVKHHSGVISVSSDSGVIDGHDAKVLIRFLQTPFFDDKQTELF